jgi:hypothetical protein
MNTHMTPAEVQGWCRKFAEHVGSNASASINIGCFGQPYMFVMRDVSDRGNSKTFYGPDWESMFAQAQAWAATIPDPDAEYLSWETAA